MINLIIVLNKKNIEIYKESMKYINNIKYIKLYILDETKLIKLEKKKIYIII